MFTEVKTAEDEIDFLKLISVYILGEEAIILDSIAQDSAVFVSKRTSQICTSDFNTRISV